MGGWRLRVGVAAVLLAALAGCGSVVASAIPAEESYPVGVRTLDLSRGVDRPLPTTIWYPAAGVTLAPDGPGTPVLDALPAPGRFPIVLFSHGLNSRPEHHAQLTTRWAAAGFVVVAPAYPHTKLGAAQFDRNDVRHQPADAWHVLRAVRSLDRRLDDPLAGHLAASRVAAVGHSAGGYTTAGLLTAGHSATLRGAVIIAGGTRHRFGGPPVPVLFVHGSADRVVRASAGWSAYRQVPWDKAFVTVVGQGHGEYLIPGEPGFPETASTISDFLRWTLHDDSAARDRLPLGADVPGITTWTGRI
ncbi:MAG TPA: alpha/beta hydrolase [Micromonosporaceae bacterium]|nr:alpha/beta hydrolase [Micromonosporaceae bacterium]